VTAVSALSNTSQSSVYNYARRPILRTGLRPVQLLLVFVQTIKFVTGGGAVALILCTGSVYVKNNI